MKYTILLPLATALLLRQEFPGYDYRIVNRPSDCDVTRGTWRDGFALGLLRMSLTSLRINAANGKLLVSGTVIDKQSAEPLPGVTVALLYGQGRKCSTSRPLLPTDDKGQFSLVFSDQDSIRVYFSLPGMENLELKLTRRQTSH